ncbi:sporulation protein rmd1 [Brettanomyces nanus]|uniref:Sporulation protein rmd1 n=1 Tax=Eeniella nana TaxID=13502 RepID=A0A875RQG8_EENNA|nr:sporulation protein rmd1 [Brettanomyces nanus]QPG76910.1 sporulation protein rmd1 [Brettanomyces nanus]
MDGMIEEPSERTTLLSDNPYGNDSVGDGESRAGSRNSVIGKKSKSIAQTLGPGMVPQRSSRTSQKLKLLPESLNYESEVGDAKQLSLQRIKDTPARKDAERLGKKQRSILPRVTAYCTAGSYRMRDLIRWLQDKKRIHSTAPKLFDECIYTPFAYKDWRHSNGAQDILRNIGQKKKEDNAVMDNKIIRFDDEGGEIDLGKLSTDLFIFEYGVLVMWGFSKKEEGAFLEDLARFENEKLSDEDVQAEEFNYYVTQSYQPRIYNDFISLRDDSNYMTKLSISYAISQSVKISLFEELVDNTIEDTQDIPQQISQTGKVEMAKGEIMKSIGELFILRININLHGAILDSPELMWSEPQLEPIYQATRGYLEINQRVTLLNQRLEVIADLLQMLKEQLTHNDDEQLELIVIVLIAAEVLVSLINIIVDLIAGKKR